MKVISLIDLQSFDDDLMEENADQTMAIIDSLIASNNAIMKGKIDASLAEPTVNYTKIDNSETDITHGK